MGKASPQIKNLRWWSSLGTALVAAILAIAYAESGPWWICVVWVLVSLVSALHAFRARRDLRRDTEGGSVP